MAFTAFKVYDHIRQFKTDVFAKFGCVRFENTVHFEYSIITI